MALLLVFNVFHRLVLRLTSLFQLVSALLPRHFLCYCLAPLVQFGATLLLDFCSLLGNLYGFALCLEFFLAHISRPCLKAARFASEFPPISTLSFKFDQL